MSWSVIEGTTKVERDVPPWMEYDPNDTEGGVLCWQGQPVDLPCRPLFRSWTTPWGARNHVAVIPFENGWEVELRFEEGAPAEVSMSGIALPHPERLVLSGHNVRAYLEHQQWEEEQAAKGLDVGTIGDEWDFSYLKTGYQYPGVWVQWNYYETDHDKIIELAEDDPFCAVPDLETLQSRLQRVAAMPSDPVEAARLAKAERDGSQ